MDLNKLIAAAPDIEPPVFDMVAYDKMSGARVRGIIRKEDITEIVQALKDVWAEYNAFPKVQYKTYSLLNCKKTLRRFQKKRAPRTINPSSRPGIGALNKRVMGDGIIYTMAYTPRRVIKLPEMPADRKDAGLYGAGFFCNNHYMVRIPRPKTKRPLKDAHSRMVEMINDAHPDAGTPVAVVEETYNYGTNEWVAYAHFYGVKTHERVNAVHLDVIYKYHPGARAQYTNKHIDFFIGPDLIGIIMPVY